MKTPFPVIVAIIALAFTHHSHAANAATITYNGQSEGITPFINRLSLTVSPASALESIEFMIEPKPSSATRPVAASYSSAYLQSRGYLDLQTGQITLPVFGLYANYSNTVVLTYVFNKGPAVHNTIIVPTAVYNDVSGIYTNPTVLQARLTHTKLSYDYIMLKAYVASISPVIIDTDGEVRWTGTTGTSSLPAIFFENGIYISSGAATGLTRMEFDGTSTNVADYAGLGVISTDHHNFDPGKSGILVEVNTTNWTESVILEVDGGGNILKTWSLGDIISAAMIAGGDDPSAFVRAAPDDWFHNNACTYRKSDDTLIVSSRENFVIALDYETGAIKWILGDPTKAWYQYPSLRKFALTLVKDSLPPVGQHAVSITKDNCLLLFDDGANSQGQTPAGTNRTYSASRKYRLNTKKMTAKEVWNYISDPPVYSPFCSSVYEDRPRNYLIDYSLGGPFIFTEIIGLDSHGNKVFDYSYPAASGSCGVGWNAIPIHLENVVYP